jgi:hypothetical protein
MTDRRRSGAVHAQFAEPRGEDAGHEDNPFAPPPEGRPDQPWQPRHQPGQGGSSGDDGSGRDGQQDGGRPSPAWGSRWSSSQPGRQGGPFGGPGQQGHGDRGDGPGPGGPRLRWDPTDPLQRHARYALHAGIWALFFALINVPAGALLLGMPAVYWGGHALRGRRKDTDGSAPHASARPDDMAGSDRRPSLSGPFARVAGADRPVVPPEQAARTRKAAAASGLVAAVLALLVVAGTFTVQSVYSDFFTCRQDALTQASREQCTQLLPPDARMFLDGRG